MYHNITISLHCIIYFVNMVDGLFGKIQNILLQEAFYFFDLIIKIVCVSFSVRKVPLKEEILVKTSFIIAFSSSAKQLIHTKCCAMRCRCLEQNLKGRPSMELKSREQFTLFFSLLFLRCCSSIEWLLF